MASFYIFLGILSMVGGIQLIRTNGMGIPVAWLENTPFSSFLIPGLILTIVIGGLSLLTAILMFLKRKFAIICSAALGFGLLIWIFVEMYLIHESFWLQAAIFIIAVLIVIVSMLLYKLYLKNIQVAKK
jgi:hypothetical protein